MSFPELSYKQISIESEDIGISSKKENGKVISRKKFTKARKTFAITLNIATEQHKADLETFFNEVGTYLTFSWINPLDDISYVVRFEKPLTFSKSSDFPNYWSISNFNLVEA